MFDVLRCCPPQSMNEPYIGVDQKCNEPAIFCIEHTPHKNSEGLMHQMLPLKHFKKTLQQKKFKMNQKIGILIDQYNNLMDSLIEEIRQLKLRKNIQFSMLWLRQLAKDQQEYELMRQIYRMDFKDLSCSLVHSIYFKIIHNQILQKKSVKQIDCYKGISDILDHLSQQRQARSFLSKKIAEIQGILQNGEILKRALPDKMVFKQNIKQVLLQSPHQQSIQIKYNKCKLTKSSRQYMSIFSKYPIVPHIVYHINFSTKYANVMLGLCTDTLIEASKNIESKVLISQNQHFSSISSGVTQFDKHYSKQSIVFNCTNGCIYKDGMFQSGSNTLTKGQKQLVLKLRVTATNQMIIMLGKHVLSRQNIQSILEGNGRHNKLFLHILLRTEGDSFDVDRDKDISSDQLASKAENNIQKQNNYSKDSRQNINFEQLKRRNEQQALNIINLKEQIVSEKQRYETENNASDSFSYDFRHLNSSKLLQKQFQSKSSLLGQKKVQNKIKSNAVQKQVKRIQQKMQQKFVQQKKPINLLTLNENDKQKKINDLIKKERIDKILNDIKSKPNSNIQRENTAVGKRLKQIQQKNSLQPSWKNSDQSVNDMSANYQINIPSNYQSKRIELQNDNLYLKNSFGDVSCLNNKSDLMASQNLQQVAPLLTIKKSDKDNSPSIKFSSFQNEDNQDYSRQTNFGAKKLQPYEKNFKLEDDQSEEMDYMRQNQLQSPSYGGMTPMDKINDFQFAKKSLNLKQALKDSSMFKPKLDIEQKIKKAYKNQKGSVLQEESSENLKESQNLNRYDQSEVIESFEVRNADMTKKSGIRMPQLKHSHFSKLNSKSNLHDISESGIQSSFGGFKGYTIKKPPQQSQTKLLNPMDRLHLLESVIDIKSNQQFQKSNLDFSASNVHIGNVLSPKAAAARRFNFGPSDSSQIIQESLQMGGQEDQDFRFTNLAQSKQ